MVVWIEWLAPVMIIVASILINMPRTKYIPTDDEVNASKTLKAVGFATFVAGVVLALVGIMSLHG